VKDLKIFTNNIEGEALNQIHNLLEQEAFSNAKVRIMPDVHAGSGCVIGFTADLGDKVIPNVVGVDIGCGMLTVELGQVDIHLRRFDDVVKTYIPSGFSVHDKPMFDFNFSKIRCYDKLKNVDRILNSIGTLGGGNHFIELDVDKEKNVYLIIHTGSRNLGKQVADYYQKLAIEKLLSVSNEEKQKVIDELKAQNRQRDIPDALKSLTPKTKIPKDLAYLVGKDREDYLHDMRICQLFASVNRKAIAKIILEKYDLKEKYSFETVHNYIDYENIVRKGAISAHEDELVLIPINMRDGCIIGRGLGNKDWNYSAPHGSGRLMSRGEAKRNLDLVEFQIQMLGIYTTTANQSTLDEAPNAYKPMQEIIDNIKETVEIIEIIKPIYNFKASE
jgi:tRNA-splicing ligase RtcB (3'-phosphate/5'-hydroxy nucleic acid ligase)